MYGLSLTFASLPLPFVGIVLSSINIWSCSSFASFRFLLKLIKRNILYWEGTYTIDLLNTILSNGLEHQFSNIERTRTCSSIGSRTSNKHRTFHITSKKTFCIFMLTFQILRWDYSTLFFYFPTKSNTSHFFFCWNTLLFLKI